MTPSQTHLPNSTDLGYVLSAQVYLIGKHKKKTSEAINCSILFVLISIEQMYTKITYYGLESVTCNLDT